MQETTKIIRRFSAICSLCGQEGPSALRQSDALHLAVETGWEWHRHNNIEHLICLDCRAELIRKAGDECEAQMLLGTFRE